MTQINVINLIAEERLAAYAQANGMGVAGVVEKLALEHLPPVADEDTLEQRRRAESIAFLDSLLAQVPTNPEELRKADEEHEEFMTALNNNRIMAGEEPLF
jgi:hypothetical protein